MRRASCDLEEKALSVGSGPDGGYLGAGGNRSGRQPRAEGDLADPRDCRRPPGFGHRLQAAVRDVGYGYRLDWLKRRRVAQTNTPVLAELQFPTMELYAMPAASIDVAR